MEQSVLVAITAVVSVALVFQVVASWGTYRSIRSIAERIDRLAADFEHKLGPISERAQELLVTAKSVGESFKAIEARIAATSEVVHGRVVALDSFLEETTQSARLQVARIENLVDATSSRVEETIRQVQHGILSPLEELSALVRGVRVGFDFFFRGRRAQSRQAHQDEEMFI